MFLTNWLMVTRIVAASVIEAVDYPTPEEFFLAFDGTNTLFMYGGSKDTSSTSNVAIYYDGYKHETGNAYPVVLSEPGEYKALVDVCGTRYLTEAVTVGAMTPPSIPIGTPSTLAFHHGNFDNVYGDGDVSTAATNGHVYADTPTGTYSWGTLSARSTTSTNTTYEWTPSATMIADVLMVAGGGGGGNWYSGGGGGAGGLVFLENGSISGQKTVVVGNGGSGATNNPLVGGGTDDIPGSNGSDTSMSGFTTAIGGGGGASYNVNGNSGGSGGGGGYNTTGGAGTNNQGYDGGDSYLNGWGGGGGGGSGGPGYDETSNKGGNGGIGTNLSSIYGVLYGDSGFFASGGGGGGGARWNNSSSLGGSGGSGIVLLSYQYSTDQLTYNNYNKLTIANTSNANVETNLRLGANTWDIATGSNVWICKPGDYKSFTVDPDGQTAYFGNVTVGTVTEEVEVSPQLWWNTYTNSSTVDDSSPNNLDGTLNSVTDTDGAFTFDGSSSYIQMATTGATDSNVQLAMWDISCEFYKTGSGTTGGYIDRQAVVLVTKGINAGDGDGYDINYGLVIDSNNKLCTGFEEAGSNQIIIASTATISNDQWYTARATFDGTTLNLYLDETLEATSTPTISPASSDLGPFLVGAGRYDTSYTPVAYFQGRIKNVKVYDDIFVAAPQPPSLTFDGYNKLSIENLTPTSTRLTYGSNTYEIGTASNVYIEHEGTYKMATGDATTFALVSKEVGTQPSGTTYNLTSLTRVSNYSTTNTSKAQVSGNGTWPVSSFMATHNVLNNGDKAYGKTDGGSSRDPAQLFDTISSGWGEASHGTNGTHSPMSWGYEFTSGAKMISKMILYQPPNTHPAGNVTIKYWDGTSITTVSNQSPIGMTSEVALSSTEFTFDAVSSQYWQIDCYRHATQTTGYTGLSEWEIYGNVITTINTPSLTYDTSNKLSIENLTPTSTILTDPNGSSFDIGTALNVYIRDSGTYSIASKDANTFVLTSNTVTGTPTGTTYTHTILTGSHTRISDRDASNTNRTHNSGSSDWPDSNSGITHYQDLSNGDRSYQKTNGGDSRDAAQLFDGVDSGNWGNASHGNVGTHSPMTWGYKFTSGSKQCSQMILVQPPNTHHAGNVTIKYWDGTSMTAVSNQSPLSMDNQTTDNDPTTFTFDAVSSQFWQIDCYRGSDNSTGYTGLHAWEIYDNPYEYVTGTTPSQTYDNTKTITVKNVPSTLTDVAGKIYKGSTAYTIHATTSSSNVIIENAGTYVSVFTTATQAFLTNAIDATEPTTTSDDTTIEDEGFIPGSTAVTTVTTTDAPSVTLDATDTTVTDPTLDLDFTTTLPRTLKRYNNITSSSIGARFNRHETRKKRVEKSISIPTSFSAELTANNASSPTTLTVTVANSKFVINGDETPTLGFIRGETYTFDQSDASNSGHPLVLATSEDGATQYTTGWTTTPSSPDYVPGVSGAQGTFIVPYDVPDTIYYKCNVHPNMGGEINTTFGNVFSLGDFTVAANTHVSGEYTLATNYDGTTSNLYVNGELITQTTPSPAISAGVKEFILGKEFDGYVKNFKFWNYAKRFRPPGIYPQTLPSIDSSGIWHNSTEYRWRSSEPGYEIYGRWRIDFSPEAFDAENENIRVNTTTNIWEDSGTANPTGVTDGSTVTLTIDNGASVLYKFTKPTDASWID